MTTAYRHGPSIISAFDSDVCLVLDDFEPIGWAYREIEEHVADRETIIRALMSGQYNDPVRIVAFNTAEGWAAMSPRTFLGRSGPGRGCLPGRGSNAETRNIAR